MTALPTQSGPQSSTPQSFGQPPRSRPPRFFLYLGLLLATVFFMLPVYLLVVTALKQPSAISLDKTWALPGIWNWGSFVTAWNTVSGSLGNSFFLAIVATALAAVLGSLNGYVLSKWKFKGANLLFALMLFGMFIPYQAILIPLFQFVKALGLYGSIWALVLAHVVYGLPITTLIFRNYYSEVPDALIEAARIDGAGFWFIYGKVLFPISVPAFVVVVIWEFTQVWNEFLFGVTLTNPASQPITVALAQLSGGQAVSWNLPMAGALLAAIPTLLVYILLGQYFVKGLLAGSVKG